MERKNVATMGGKLITLVGEQIKVGDQAREFTVLDNNLNPVTLADAKGKNIIISVVPSVDTSVCAAQTRRFNEEAANFKDTVIYTISVDLPFALGRFCGAEGIDNVVTLSDHRDLDFALKYGFLIKEHRLLERGIVIVDKSNTVRYVEYVSEVTNHPDYEKALKALAELQDQ